MGITSSTSVPPSTFDPLVISKLASTQYNCRFSVLLTLKDTGIITPNRLPLPLKRLQCLTPGTDSTDRIHSIELIKVSVSNQENYPKLSHRVILNLHKIINDSLTRVSFQSSNIKHVSSVTPRAFFYRELLSPPVIEVKFKNDSCLIAQNSPFYWYYVEDIVEFEKWCRYEGAIWDEHGIVPPPDLIPQVYKDGYVSIKKDALTRYMRYTLYKLSALAYIDPHKSTISFDESEVTAPELHEIRNAINKHHYLSNYTSDSLPIQIHVSMQCNVYPQYIPPKQQGLSTYVSESPQDPPPSPFKIAAGKIITKKMRRF